MLYPVLVPVAISVGSLAIRYLSRLLSSALQFWDIFERPSISYLRDRICQLFKDRFGFEFDVRFGLELLCMDSPYQVTYVPLPGYLYCSILGPIISSSTRVPVPLRTRTGSTWYTYPCIHVPAWLSRNMYWYAHLRYTQGYPCVRGKQLGRVGQRVYESPTITYGLSTNRCTQYRWKCYRLHIAVEGVALFAMR